MPMPTLGRRDVGLGALALGTTLLVGSRPTSARGIPPSGTIPFTARRTEGELGYHRVTFEQASERLVVTTEIMFRVRLGFIPVFRFTHQSQEIWSGGRLISMESQTDDNGDEYQVSAQATASGLRVTGSGGNYTAPADTMPGSYWNIEMLDRQEVLHTHRGEITPIDTEFLGNEIIAAGPRQIAARHHRVIGPTLEIDVWYNDADQWVKLAVELRGSRLEYDLQPGGPGSPNLLRAG